METDHPIRILIVEDLPSDAELAERELRKGGLLFTAFRVETKEAFLKALKDFRPELIISDYSLPEFNGMQALKLTLEHDVNLPLIVVTGSINEETAVACMKAGATDYVLKDRITRLPFAVKEALKQKKLRSAREEAELALQKSEEQYRKLVEHANEGIFVAQDDKLRFINRMGCKMSGYSKEELTSRPFLEFIHPEDRDMVMKTQVARIKGDKPPYTKYPFRLITKDENIKWLEGGGVLIEWEGEPATLNFFSDITKRKQAEENLQVILKKLRQSIGTTIQVMVSAVETRDPYTAGHQARSADLARAIANEMNLSQYKIDGIRMAASIHDIGKLSVPSEILSKPTKLMDLEFSLIKEHPKTGYEILQNVESPWPLAEMVYQHHERMDGSGYPRGIRGAEILIEARILAVADVIEAMASHRPYRPAMGIDAALDEIEKNKGILYDTAVVEACLILFRKKGFRFE